MKVMNRCFKAVLVPAATLAISAAVVLPSGVAGAQTPRQAVSLSVFAGTGKLPTSTIKTRSETTAYHPAALSATYAGPKAKTCISKYYGIVVTNGTASTQVVTYNGSVEGVLPKHTSGGICFWGTEKQNFVFGLKGSTSQLTVSVSP
jgi:hypothetical protein